MIIIMQVRIYIYYYYFASSHIYILLLLCKFVYIYIISIMQVRTVRSRLSARFLKYASCLNAQLNCQIDKLKFIERKKSWRLDCH